MTVTTERPTPRTRAAGRSRRDARALAAEVERLVGPPLATTARDRLWGWAGPLLVTALAAVLRFWHLATPHALVFDETYYVRNAWTMLATGIEMRWPDGTDKSFVAGDVDVYSSTGDYVVHPSVGKWMIAIGEQLFGVQSSFGWRFSAALVGTLSVLLVARITRRLLRSTLLGTTAGLLLAVDGLHLVMSRTGILDIFLGFWVLVAFGLLLLDRDWMRRRLAGAVVAARGSWPRLWWRPWRLAAAVALALACSVKWSGLYFVAAFLLMSVLWDVSARRRAGLPRWWTGLLRDGVPAAVVALPTVLVIYTASWAGWFASSTGHLRNWASENPGQGVQWLPPALRSLWKYHQDMWAFHTGLDSPHAYKSSPWAWMVQGRPTSFYYQGQAQGVTGCGADSCTMAITSLGNPVIWWTGCVALLVLLFCWALRRDWRAGAILAGVAAGWLPWFTVGDRTIFQFYAVVFAPFVVMAVVYCFGLLIGPPAVQAGAVAGPLSGPLSGPLTGRRLTGVVVSGAVVVLAVVAASYFWPVWTAQLITYDAWRARMWFASWI
ncbi:C-terminal four TMM region of protein-O-mannosyltransferase [Quadrisphaera granulorum]|uniref:Polyprenol-phosphate-mannose--protein mannosyltransferase n=1 Tax=Quadrisphaera granulorum TaxID=317664 RepID=A0A316AD36_9ACTN|nr:phospholipid carrier-dependent glycosyltransferase [Quadrisphaera granulorum]PWJ55158.1 protein-O-mannosyltransferase-like protein [Quadrisphaera granulorum]SZE95667.1 C-terminal four TMM region of protein-O-mannosyltransferase [Quadrisphaera granulorum]